MLEREITRRTFLRLSALATTGAVMAACAPAVQEAAPAEVEAAPAAASGPEAPMLAEMVESGALPPLEERLPENSISLGCQGCENPPSPRSTLRGDRS